MAKIKRNITHNGIEARFDEKPEQEIINWLKSKRYRYNRNKFWYIKFTPERWEEIHQYFNLETPDTKALQNKNEIMSLKKDVLFLAGLQSDKENDVKNSYDINLFKSSLASKLKTKKRNGEQDVVDQTLTDLIEESAKLSVKPPYTKKHSIWNLHSDPKAVKAMIGKKPVPKKEEGKLMLYRGAKEDGGSWWTPSKKSAEAYSEFEEGRTVQSKEFEFKKVAEPKDIRKAAISVGLTDQDQQALYWLLTPDVYEGAPKVIEQLIKDGFDAAHLPKGEDFTPEGEAMESYLMLNAKIAKQLKDEVLTNPDTEPEAATIEVEGEDAMQEAEQEFKESNTVGQIRPDFMQTSILKGREIKISMPNNEKRDAQFVIAELDSVIPSHDINNFSSDPEYPKDPAGNNINDRNYQDDLSAQKAVMDYARNLEPERLITTSRTPSGTPIVTKDGFVVSGNNRTMSMKLAQSDYKGNIRLYRQYLQEEIESFGFENDFVSEDKLVVTNKKGETRHFSYPVLVRIDYDFPKYDTEELSKYNKDTKKSERPIDRAIKLSNILASNPQCANIIAQTTGEFETFSEMYADQKAIKELKGELIQCNLLTAQEISAYFTGDSFTEYGKEFVQNVLASMILKRDALMASEVPGVKMFKQKIVTSLPVLMKNSKLGDASLIDEINEAVVLQQKIKGSGNSFEDWIRSYSMFGEKVGRKVVYLNRLLDSGKFAFKQAIEKYNENIVKNQGASMFGDQITPDQVFEHFIVGGVDDTYRKLIEASAIVDKPIIEAQKEIVKPEWDKMQEFIKENEPETPTEMTAEPSKPESPKITPANIQYLRRFIGESQIEAIMAGISGEEGDFFRNMLSELIGRIENMPETYQTEGVKTEDKIAHLHYFSGASDWYVVEKDAGVKGEMQPPAQYQAFGYAVLNGDLQNAELGYISIPELIELNVELDLYWEPKRLGEIMEGEEQEKQQMQDEETDQSREWFGYQFEFKPVNKEGKALRDALTDRGVEWIPQPDDGMSINVAKVKFHGNEYSFFDNSGEFKVDGPDGMIGQIDFKEPDGPVKPISVLADEIKEMILLSIKEEVMGEESVADTSPKIEVEEIIIDYYNRHGKREAYLYNNRNMGLNSKEQYEVNHKWIADQPYVSEEDIPGLQPSKNYLAREAIRKGPDKGEEEYKNEFELNRAIERLLNEKWNEPAENFSVDEKLFIKRYSGYGGLKEEIIAAGEMADEGILYEFYTPDLIIQKMWGLAYKHGYKGGPTLEPSVGVGRFFDRQFVKDYIVKMAFETNKYSAKICKILYPEVQVNYGRDAMAFEQVFLKDNWTVKGNVKPVADLVIGNPPYGSFLGKYAAMGEKKYTKATNYIDYFIFRGLDLLNPGGLLVYIIGAETAAGGTLWIDQGGSACKDMIAEKAELIDAYRLPSGVFERTGVASDIIVMKRK